MIKRPSQVVRKVEGSTEVERGVETGKPKEEAVAGVWCWKGFLLWGLKKTGEPFSWQKAAVPNVTFRDFDPAWRHLHLYYNLFGPCQQLL